MYHSQKTHIHTASHSTKEIKPLLHILCELQRFGQSLGSESYTSTSIYIYITMYAASKETFQVSILHFQQKLLHNFKIFQPRPFSLQMITFTRMQMLHHRKKMHGPLPVVEFQHRIEGYEIRKRSLPETVVLDEEHTCAYSFYWRADILNSQYEKLVDWT